MTSLHAEFAERAYALLKDGEWHPYEPIVQEIMKIVPPSVALRYAVDVNRKSREAQFARGAVKGLRGSHSNPTAEQLIRRGKREYARAFLKTRPFEMDRPGVPGNNAMAREANRGRKIRMLYDPRGVPDAPSRRDRLEQENQLLRDQVKRLREALINLGHGADAERIAPE